MVASVVHPYLEISLAESSGHESKLLDLMALSQVVRTGENKAA